MGITQGHSLLLLILLAISSSQAKVLCPRIFFQNINEYVMPYKNMEDVYVKESYTKNGFPVYKGNKTKLLVYYLISEGNKYLSFGSELDDSKYFGVAAQIYSYTEPATWLSTGTLDRRDVFSGLIYKWQYWDMRAKGNTAPYMNPKITAVCVEKEFRECNSDKVYMTDTITDANTKVVLNDPTTDYFQRETGDFRGLRPVFYQSKAKWYLQYDSSESTWYISSTRSATSTNNGLVWLKVKDYALRPEYITNEWQIMNNGWKQAPLVKIKCRGIRHGTNGCTSGGSPCGPQSKCVYTSGNETVCVCNTGYTGPRCTDNKQCAVPSLLDDSSEIGGKYNERTPGSLMMVFCATSDPKVRFGICQDGKYGTSWVRKGNSCIAPRPTYAPTSWSGWSPTTRYPYYPGGGGQSRKIDFDDYPAVIPAVLTCAVILQIFLPAFVWLVAFCMRKCKESGEEREDQTRMQEFTDNLEGRLQDVARAESQEQLDVGVREYQDAVRRYQKEQENEEKKRKKGLYRNAGFWRLYSMGMWFSFLMWMVFLIGCSATKCMQYGVIFFHLWLFAIIMLCIAPIFFLIESCLSHERSYIKNIMEDESAWDYIRRMHEVAPVLHMQVECYHYETRTRIVYYTDSNGNTQSRTETYQEKVVTFVDDDTFSYGCFRDVSKREMPELSKFALTRLKIDPNIQFGDQETTESFEEQKEEMMERNRHRDVYTDFSMRWEIPGLEKRISAYVDMRLRPFWIRERYYWLATLLCMTWPYRWFFRANTAKNYYDLKKKLYKSPTPPPEVDLMDPIALLRSTGGNPSFQGSALNVNELSPLVNQPTPPLGHGAPYPTPNAQPSAPPYPTPSAQDSSTPYPTPSAQASAPPYPTPSSQFPAQPYPNPSVPPPYSPSQGAYSSAYPPGSGAMYPPGPVPMQDMDGGTMPPNIPPPAYDSVVSQGGPPAKC